RETIPQAESALQIGLRYDVTGRSRKAERGNVTNRIAYRRAVKDSAASANERAAGPGNPVGESKSRSEVIGVCAKRSLGYAVHAGESNHAWRARNRDRKSVV